MLEHDIVISYFHGYVEKMKVLNQSAATLKKFYRQSEYRLGDSVRHFCK